MNSPRVLSATAVALLLTVSGPRARAAEPDAPALKLDVLRPYFAGSKAVEAFAEQRWADAARLFAAWLDEHTAEGTDPALRSRAELLRATSLLHAGKATSAADGFEAWLAERGRATGDPLSDALGPHVRLLAAEARLREGRPELALAHVQALDASLWLTPFSLGERRDLVRLRALVKVGLLGEAAILYASHLSRYPDSLPSVYLEAVAAMETIGEVRRADAARGLRALIAHHPGTESATKAKAKLETYPEPLRAFGLEERLTWMRAEHRAKRRGEAIAAAERVLKDTRVGSEPWCEARLVRARTFDAQKKAKLARGDYDLALPKCTASSVGPDLAFSAAKHAMHQKDATRALTLFGDLAKRYPEHSFADDALRFRATLFAGQNKPAEAEKALLATVEHGVAHEGDQQEEAAWALVWGAFREKKLNQASALAKKVTRLIPWERTFQSAGRLRYWQGRIEQLRGRKKDAMEAYAACIVDYPLTFYGMLAEARLRGLDRRRLAQARADAEAKPPEPEVLEAARARLETPAMQRAIELMRLGLDAFAKAELDALGFGGPAANATDDWLHAALLDRSGDVARSHNIARRKHPEFAKVGPLAGHRERWELAYPRPARWQSAVTKAAKTSDVDEALVWAVMREESSFRPGAVSPANAFGLMQLILPTGRAMAKQAGVAGAVDATRLKQPSLNIQLGTRYLGKLARRFESHPALMAAGYNAGPGGPSKWLRKYRADHKGELDVFVETIPYDETRGYVKRVVTSWLRYRYLWGEGGPAEVAMRVADSGTRAVR